MKANLTNRLSKLVEGNNVCKTSAVNVEATSDTENKEYRQARTNINKTGSLEGLNCYVEDKNIYVRLATATEYEEIKKASSENRAPNLTKENVYTILGAYNNTDILMTNSSKYNKQVTAFTLQRGTKTITTCDGDFNVDFDYTSFDVKVILNTLANYKKNIHTLASGETNKSFIIQNRKWYRDVTTKDLKGNITYDVKSYNGAIGYPTEDQYNYVFKMGIFEDSKYWLATSLKYNQSRRLQGDLYHWQNVNLVLTKNAATTAVVFGQEGAKTAYVNTINSAYNVKPIFATRDFAVCAGTGTVDDPYLVTGTKVGA